MNETPTYPLLSCINKLINDGNYSCPFYFQITQTLYAHPVYSPSLFLARTMTATTHSSLHLFLSLAIFLSFVFFFLIV